MSSSAFKVVSRVLTLDLGMYIFRYAVPAGETHKRSCVSLHQSPVGKGSIDCFPGEGISRNTMGRPGDCIVVRVKGAQAGILITEYHPHEDANRINLRVDKIDTSAEPAASPVSPKPAESSADANICAIEWSGHIETRGDITSNEPWLGNPNSALRLEGFAAKWLRQPEGLDLAYLCRTGKGSEPQVGLAGKFVGTRRQAKPITAIAFALTGPNASDYELTGEVVFAGSPPLAISPDKELSGPQGTEQLVAIRVSITPRAAQASSPASPWSDPAKTQVFK
ncbi:hypothetical protein [Pseudomonas sp. Marseille-QA0892]